MQPEALIFDVDGTLAETEELHRQAFNDTFAEQRLGWHWTRDDYCRLLRTTGGKERIARHMREIGAEPETVDIPALHHAKTARYTDLVASGGLTLRPGIADLIHTARQASMTLAIATTTSRPNVNALLQATLGVAPETLFAAIACGDEVAAKKPAPDVYLLALERLGMGPKTALAFEDSANGLQSALAAGLDCIVTPSAYTQAEDFTGAAEVVPDVTCATIPGLERATIPTT